MQHESRRTAEAKALIHRAIQLVSEVDQLLRLDPEAFERAWIELCVKDASRAAMRSIGQILTRQDSEAFARQLLEDLRDKYG